MAFIITSKNRPRVSLRELETGKSSEIMKKYKMTEHQLQQEVHKHCDDGTYQQKQDVYQTVFSNQKK
jgi:hypothetical protein